jgi:CheY-like chemotaxis protein
VRSTSHLEADESALFGDAPAQARDNGYEIDSAMQGQDGLEMVLRAARNKIPYAVVFADMRMPPGWDGVETIERILQVTPRVELCICSAYSDYSWHEVIRRVGRPGLRLLRKPFDTYELLNVASELTDKWHRLHASAPAPATASPGARKTAASGSGPRGAANGGSGPRDVTTTGPGARGGSATAGPGPRGTGTGGSNGPRGAR